MAAKLDIKRELNAVDSKNFNFYKNLTEEEKKAFSPYILMRYTSNAKGESWLQEWYLERTNEFVNKNFWDLSKNHKELLWNLYAGVGTGINSYHPYIAQSKKEKISKIEKLLAEIHPTYKISDIKLLASLMTEKDKEDLFDKMGFDKKQRKEYE